LIIFCLEISSHHLEIWFWLQFLYISWKTRSGANVCGWYWIKIFITAIKISFTFAFGLENVCCSWFETDFGIHFLVGGSGEHHLLHGQLQFDFFFSCLIVRFRFKRLIAIEWLWQTIVIIESTVTLLKRSKFRRVTRVNFNYI
jgi:hypothetical protein